jgi:GTPase SAR1 family protein
MTQSVYIIGGAGSGKSTFMNQLLDGFVMTHGPLIDLHSKRNAKALVTLRGHRMNGFAGERGIYLGHLRDSFPGTDGLDRASSPTGAEWLENGPLPDFIIAEGATLATRPFLTALAQRTSLLLVHLWADEMITELRFFERGSGQDPKFVANTVTRSRNLHNYLESQNVPCLSVDTGDTAAWNLALAACFTHLKGTG